MDYAEVFRASPARVVALLRCQDLHQPLSAQLGSHHGFHVLCVPDSDAEYPPPVAERKQGPMHRVDKHLLCYIQRNCN